MKKTRILVVDDSPLIRQILTDMLKAEPDMEVIGQARNGAEALQMTNELRPDVVTLDVEMPKVNGLEALRNIMQEVPTPVIMVSTLTAAGTSTTMEALAAGAFDFVCKPQNGALTALKHVRMDLVEKIRSARYARVGRSIAPAPKPVQPIATTDKVVVVASSTGGPRALGVFFESLPKGFPAPIVIVQHMPPGFVASLANRLSGYGTVPCSEAKKGDKVTPGRAFIAPAGYHMRIRKSGEFEFDTEPTLNGVRPAADHLFDSAAKVYGNRCIGVVLTGMGKDGADGSKAIKSAGGTIFTESEETCTIFGMPKATVALGIVDAQYPINNMASAVTGALKGRLERAS